MPIINETLYESLFKSMINGFAHCRAIYDASGKMVDWIYVIVNPAFETQTGLSNVAGKSVSVVIPNILRDNPELFEIYERVAKTGQHERFEQEVKALNAFFDISVYSVEQHTFTAIFENVTKKRNTIQELHLANENILLAFVSSLEFRDKDTEEHTLRVTELAVKLATAMGLSNGDIVNIRRGALLHDVGKIGIPDDILHKPGVLTDEEWVVMRQHPRIAYDLLSPIKYLRKAIDIPYCHHEHWDGGGYPRGLKGEAIPYLARIFTVVDYFDALMSDRPYRGAYPQLEALTIMDSENGATFDPSIYKVFKEIIRV